MNSDMGAQMTQNPMIRDEVGTMCFWCPPEQSTGLSEKDINDFVQQSDKCGFAEEQALGYIFILYNDGSEIVRKVFLKANS